MNCLPDITALGGVPGSPQEIAAGKKGVLMVYSVLPTDFKSYLWRGGGLFHVKPGGISDN